MDLRLEMPVDVAVDEPRPDVVREEADGHFVAGVADADGVADDGVVPVVGAVSGAAHDEEGMTVQMHRVLRRSCGEVDEYLRVQK